MPNLVRRFIMEKDLESRLIGYATDSLWCHTEGLSRDGAKWVGAHAGTGVQSRALNWAGKLDREATYAVPVTDAEYAASMAWQESMLGTKYGYDDIVGLALHVRTLGLAEHSVICSAFMLECDQRAGLRPLNCLEEFDALVTPETYHLSPQFIGRRVPSLLP